MALLISGIVQMYRFKNIRHFFLKTNALWVSVLLMLRHWSFIAE